MPRRKKTEEEKEAERIAEQKVLIESKLKRELEDLRESYINEPTRFYKVGDRVIRGSIKNTTITEVLDDGKIYKVHEICTEKNYGNPYDYERDSYIAWHDARPYVPVENWDDVEPFSDQNYVGINYYQTDIGGILCSYYSFGFDDEVDYQRGLVWKLEDKVALIESIMNHVDIGKFTFIRRDYAPDTKSYEVLDGKQRLNALVEFYEGRFAYRGKYYLELHPQDRMLFKSYPISKGETNPLTEKEKYDYFLRLNTGGKPQDLNHLAHVKKLWEEAE
jgi:hypothetical protein